MTTLRKIALGYKSRDIPFSVKHSAFFERLRAEAMRLDGSERTISGIIQRAEKCHEYASTVEDWIRNGSSIVLRDDVLAPLRIAPAREKRVACECCGKIRYVASVQSLPMHHPSWDTLDTAGIYARGEAHHS